jgi:hypothetical protein
MTFLGMCIAHSMLLASTNYIQINVFLAKGCAFWGDIYITHPMGNYNLKPPNYGMEQLLQHKHFVEYLGTQTT